MSYFKNVNVDQNVASISVLNSKTNLTAGQAWVGTFEDVTNKSAIQLIAKFDQDVTIYVDQSQNDSTPDITDSWVVLANAGFATSVTSVAPYYRIRITNGNASSVATGALTSADIAIVNILPRALDTNGYLQTSIDTIYGRRFNKNVMVTPMGELKEVTSVRLVGSGFFGSTLDSTYWTVASSVSGGTGAVVDGACEVATGTTSNNTTTLQSVRIARYVAGLSNMYRSNLSVPANTTTTGTWLGRWGVFDSANGYFFELRQANATATRVLRLVCRKTPTGGSVTDANYVASGSFNGFGGPNYVLDTNAHTFEILWTNKNAYFLIDDVLIHTFSGSTTTLVSTPNNYSTVESANSGGNTANNKVVARSGTINRLGQLLTQPIHWYRGTTTTGLQVKASPGNLHGMIIGGVAATGAVITLYDGTSTGGNIIANMTVIFPGGGNFAPTSYDFKGLPFSTGLFYVNSTQNAFTTLIFE